MAVTEGWCRAGMSAMGKNIVLIENIWSVQNLKYGTKYSHTENPNANGKDSCTIMINAGNECFT